MKLNTKGLINNPEHVKKPVDFLGLTSGNIHPTDIDLVFEFNDKFLILAEIKAFGAKIPRGQRLVLERICNAWCGGGRLSVAVELEYVNPAETDTIMARDCIVRSVYYGEFRGIHWYRYDTSPDNKQTFKEFLQILANKWKIDKLKFDEE